jgi:hypothetical protein
MLYSIKDFFTPEVNALPDGAYVVSQANKKELKYKLIINDSKYW